MLRGCAVGGLLAVIGCSVAALELKAVRVAHGLVHPWSLAFLPDGRFLVTERPGRMRIVGKDGQVGEPVAGLPPIDADRQCGLLDVALDPKFGENRLVYWSYAEPAANGQSGNGVAVARGRLDGQRLNQVQVIFRQLPKVKSSLHCGSRLVFAPDGKLFVTLGERYSRKEDAQNPTNHLGKVVRIKPDGGVPQDNPMVHTAGAKPEIWSMGHRNVQGAAINPWTGELWASEHGPQGGDELNVVAAGRNYGWPLVTYGRNYVTGTRIGEEGPKPGFEMPLRHWVPSSVAPSGMAFLSSDRYPGWKGSLFLGTLRAQVLLRLELDGRRVLKEERLLRSLNERIRDVRQSSNGWLYILTDSADGQLLRLEPSE